MNRNLFWGLLAAVLLTACEKGLDGEADYMSPAATGEVTNSMLQVTTRGGGGSNDATIAYPVQVFVFQGNDCKAVQTIGDEGQTLNIPLVEGTYSVYAVGGAGSTDYNLPTKDNATTTTALTLKEGRSLTDLMAASATATLVDGGTNTVTLGMTRKTMLIQDVTIKKIPTAATAVSVTIAPLWQALTVSGAFANAGQSQTIALTKQADNRTWTNDATAFVMPPSSQPASVSVNITIGGTTKTYTYSTSDQLEAAYKINIDGTYTEAVGVNLTGTITGATWLGERTISFEFDENGSNEVNGDDPSEPTQPNSPSSDIPSAGDTYQGCYVLAVSVIDANSAELTLLSPNERSVSSDSDANNALATLGVDGISDWSIPTKDQMDLFYAAKDDITPAPDRQRYLWQDGTTMKQRFMSDGSDSKANYNYTIFLRPVATVSITKD
ncbi:MAG: hypothetical protein IJQ59_06360 [Bacteroidaceae bacterium]|nr:hypothetical protein [Bacteroidaceae bacterium]